VKYWMMARYSTAGSITCVVSHSSE